MCAVRRRSACNLCMCSMDGNNEGPRLCRAKKWLFMILYRTSGIRLSLGQKGRQVFGIVQSWLLAQCSWGFDYLTELHFEMNRQTCIFRRCYPKVRTSVSVFQSSLLIHFTPALLANVLSKPGVALEAQMLSLVMQFYLSFCKWKHCPEGNWPALDHPGSCSQALTVTQWD